MNPSVASVIVAVVGVAGIVIGGIIQAIVGRGGRRADMTDKITSSYDRRLDRMDQDYEKLEKQCAKCETEYGAMKKVLRALVRAWDSEDHAAISAAIAAVRELT
ncbi:hypothetical protein AB0876_28610 [Mycobacterium sp. NPDC049093]